ncbi:MAG: hypothetical protein AAF235_05905 [Planctomycetota bacterium]
MSTTSETTGQAAGVVRGERFATAALSVGAVVLLALIAVTGSGVFDRTARAEMSAKSGSCSAMTTRAASRELVYIIDDTAEKLLVYDLVNGRSVRLMANEDLPQMFGSARAASGARPRP